jgi:hypothetical protein
MKHWLRLTGEKRCGKCGVRFEVGALMLELSKPPAEWKLYRCSACAGEEPRAVQSQRKEPEPVAQQMTRIGSLIASVPHKVMPSKPVLVPKKRAYRGEDYKMRQVGMYDDLPRYNR